MNNKKYETVIGLEVHVELKTKSKLFCGCTTEFGGASNTHVCEICTGMPGTLPVLNKQVVEYAMRAGLALNCEILNFNKMDRKNYFYPDLAKNFQTSQYEFPICLNGYIDIELNGQTKRVGITRIHIEEDAGKLLHSGSTISTSDYSLVDYNRAGVPLIEIVTEPDMRSAEEARIFMEKMKAILEYIDVSDCKMQEGSLRCDANVSLRPWGQKEFGTRSESKNINSFKAVQRAIEYEEIRQAELLDDGGKVVQETRTWDDANGVSLSMRSKEEAHDYRYFPEPDLPPIIIDTEWIERVRAALPELPTARKNRLMQDYNLPAYDAEVITASKDMADYFDSVIDSADDRARDAKGIANWLMGDVSAYLNVKGISIKEFVVPAANIAELVCLINKGVLSSKLAKSVFEEMLVSNHKPSVIVKEKGMEQVSDTGAIEKIVEETIAENPKSVEDYRAGKAQALGFLVGQIMRKSKGKANPGMVNQILKDKLQ